MEILGGIPTQSLTDREILLLTYQQLQTVSSEFHEDKIAKDTLIHEIDKRLINTEKVLETAEVVKEAAELRNKKQLQRIGLVFTAINLILVIAGILVSIMIAKK